MESIPADHLKQAALSLRADLCGIAPVARFAQAPAGFNPRDIFPGAQSVIVIAKRFPEGVFASPGPVPYTFACDVVLQEVLRISYALALRLQDAGLTAVPIPSEPYLYWDAEAMEGRGILSLRHAGHLAGLGVLGKNTLLTNDRYGNRITLGALLVDAVLEADPIADYAFCTDACHQCIDGCSVHALNGVSVLQKNCRAHAQTVTAKGYALYTCRTCREVCPHGRGLA